MFQIPLKNFQKLLILLDKKSKSLATYLLKIFNSLCRDSSNIQLLPLQHDILSVNDSLLLSHLKCSLNTH